MRYAFDCRKLSGTCHSKYTRAVSEPAAAPTWLPGNMLPLIGAPLVHFGQVPAGLLVVWFANHTDRKSTRLNSSHRCISYAVFCLKKKKNTTKSDNFYQSHKAYG